MLQLSRIVEATAAVTRRADYRREAESWMARRAKFIWEALLKLVSYTWRSIATLRFRSFISESARAEMVSLIKRSLSPCSGNQQ